MRCLALASELSARGCEVVFLTLGESTTIAPALARSPYARVELSHADAALDGLCGERFDALVVDSYALGAQQERGYRDHANVILVIDDLADRRHDADLLLDTTFGREPAAYEGLAPGAELLLGADYALQRPAFAALRAQTLARRERQSDIHRVLVSFGLSDPAGVTAPAVRTLAATHPSIHIDVVIRQGSAGWIALQAEAATHARIALHDDPPELAELMSQADLAVGAGGVTSWERCCLGLPTIVARLAENQRDNITALTYVGAAIELPNPLDMGTPLAEAFDRVSDPVVRLEMSRRASALSDGLGAGRVADALIAMISRRSVT